MPIPTKNHSVSARTKNCVQPNAKIRVVCFETEIRDSETRITGHRHPAGTLRALAPTGDFFPVAIFFSFHRHIASKSMAARAKPLIRIGTCQRSPLLHTPRQGAGTIVFSWKQKSCCGQMPSRELTLSAQNNVTNGVLAHKTKRFAGSDFFDFVDANLLQQRGRDTCCSCCYTMRAGSFSAPNDRSVIHRKDSKFHSILNRAA